MLVLRKTTAPTIRDASASKVERDLEYSQMRKDLLAGTLLSVFRSSVQDQIEQRLGLDWKEADRPPPEGDYLTHWRTLRVAS